MDFSIKNIKKFLSSSLFFKIILVIVLLQGLWYALSFQPTIFDEGRHVGFIQMYSDKLSPFLDQQDAQWDYLGDTTRDPNYLYYFLASLVFRVIQLFISSDFGQIVALRLIHIALFMLAIYVYQKVLTRIGFSKGIANTALVLLVLTPAIAPLAGAITYDTPAFLLSGLLLLQAMNIMQSKKLEVNKVLLLGTTIFFGSIIKYVFIAFALPVALVILWHIFKQKSYKNIDRGLNTLQTWLLAVVFVVGLGLFVERPVHNQLHYGKITPSCIELHGEQRCYANYVQARNINALNAKPDDFQPKSFYEFTFADWIPNMIRSQVRLNPWDPIISPLFLLYTLSLFGGVGVIISKLDYFLKKDGLKLGLIAVIGLSLALLVTNYQSYARLGEVVATSSRYLLPAQPLFMAFVLLAIARLKGVFKYGVITAALVLLIVSFVRGGGIIAYAKQAPPEVKWSARE